MDVRVEGVYREGILSTPTMRPPIACSLTATIDQSCSCAVEVYSEQRELINGTRNLIEDTYTCVYRKLATSDIGLQ